MSRCSCESYIIVFTTTLEELARLTMLPMFGEATAMGDVLEEKDKVKLRYLTSTMTASRTSSMSTYATWLLFFDEGDDSKSGYVMEAFLAYWLTLYVLPNCPEGNLKLYVFPLAILIEKGEKVR